MKSMGGKQPKGGYMYFYMDECKRMKEDGTHSDVRSKWNSMSDAQKEPYITLSRNDSKEYKERRKEHEKKPSWGVQNKGKSVVEVCRSKNWKALASKYGSNHKVTYAEVEEDIKSGSYRGDELKARVLLYLAGIFLCPTGDTSTNKDNMKLICDEGLKGEFNWAEYVHSRLIESIITFQKGSQRYLKGCIAILEIALFDYWSGCDSLPAYERRGVARIRAWGKEEVVRVMSKLKVDRPRKLEMDVEEVEEAEEREVDMVGGVDDGQGDYGQGKQIKFDNLMSELTDIKKIIFDIHQRQSRVEETHERHKMEVEGKIDVLVKKVEVLSGEVNMLTGGNIDGVVKEVVEIMSELSGVKEVVQKNLDEGGKLKGEIKEMKSYVENKYDELRKFEEEEKMEEEENMEEMRRKDVVKADIPIGIEPVEAAICDYLWNNINPNDSYKYIVISMGNQYAQVSDVATLKPMEWVGGVVIDLLAWTVCYDSKKSGRMIGYIPYHLAVLDNNDNVEGIASFWGAMLPNYMKFTNCEKIMITINYNNSHWYLLVLDMKKRVGTVYDSLFKSEAAKQRVKDAKRLMKILDSYNEKHIWVEACGSLGKVPLQRFKFVEHKMTKQLNVYDCGIYVMMWMKSIGSSGATGDFVVGEWDRMRILNDLVCHNQNQLREKMTKAAMLHKDNKRKG
ncbi:hypothetical protein F3Y22_tig00111208pilonHSYRG00112 [Hibiscus syriacus]|uniref:Ubiquitin-like protease family profile domain-containing protein n=1 Tax=Hibiscus syriacus TaxID=106335 RepID=A0A6A2YWJ8_HIBSY|nr:hypothetical protein F3Y22_tig00111208pilonHSYRG00112 [Hibiscus syriacus]